MSEFPKPTGEAHLTDLEHQALQKMVEFTRLMRSIIGDGPNAYHDWSEATHHIHILQSMILSQVAARAYPDEFRLLGGQLAGPAAPPDGEIKA